MGHKPILMNDILLLMLHAEDLSITICTSMKRKGDVSNRVCSGSVNVCIYPFFFNLANQLPSPSLSPSPSVSELNKKNKSATIGTKGGKKKAKLTKDDVSTPSDFR